MPGETVDVLRVPALAGIRHGFLGRRGGVSAGLFASLNVGLGSSDDREKVQETAAARWPPWHRAPGW